MRPVVCLACLWPGLVQAWKFGSLRGLGLAAAFTVSLNLAMVCSLVWPRWPLASLPAGSTAAALWVSVLGLWILGLRGTVRDWRRICPPRTATDPQIDDWFREAQHAYLKGHWIAAESLIARILARQPADAEARLLRASLQRRTKQLSQARQTLTELQPAATKWHREIAAELEQLSELEEPITTDAEPERKAA